jgi:peptidoglycan/LPS O-acetylase OafA/YrhL
MTTATSQSAPIQIDALTGIRGFAAFWVAFHHLLESRPDGLLGMPVLNELSRGGWLAVDLFFVLSGFIMMHVHGEEFRSRSFSIERARRFIALRFIRIYPAHAVVLLLHVPLFFVAMALGMRLNPDAFSTTSFFLSAFMLNGWGFPGSVGWNVPSWSVSSEWFAYLTFPVLALLVWRVQRRQTAALVMIAILGTVTLIGGSYSDWRQFMLPPWGTLIRVTSEFALGCLAYHFYHQPIGRRLAEGLAQTAFAGVLAVSIFAASPVYNALTLVFFVLLVIGLSRADGPFSRLLRTRPFMYLGRISYSVYIVHALVLAVYARIIGRIAGGDALTEFAIVAIYTALVILASHLLYTRVEDPARRWLRGPLVDGVPRTPAPALEIKR